MGCRSPRVASDVPPAPTRPERLGRSAYDSLIALRLLDRSRSRLPRPLRTALDWLVTICVASGFILAFQAEIAKPYRIPSASMEPTLHCARPATGCLARVSDRVIANRLAYRFRQPRRGEIVVFKTPASAERACGPGGVFVKRIIGLPGERVSMSNGHVAINDRRLDESDYIAGPEQAGVQSGAWRVPRESYFMLGDNRTASCDSRSWGAVRRANLIGPVVATYWPPRRIGLD
jgi:signal peptidase I